VVKLCRDFSDHQPARHISAATIARIFLHPIAVAVVILAVVAAIHLNVLRWHLLLIIPGQSTSFRRLIPTR